MEERYKTLAAEGVRNLEQYNRNIRQAIAEKRTPKEGGEYPKPLPMIIVPLASSSLAGCDWFLASSAGLAGCAGLLVALTCLALAPTTNGAKV